ncbi:hypothetical protein [Kitasatospora sp. GP82]|uniref:hypothetical protein n=1 Tax=Kitasatospora sp. GP82 TaxID=3035089 RepID=UPI002472FEE9|nr:hypothetical protein [Kitasatospora sp. GP82]MDH6126760.1 hypothetical protein [Kitasatospora sp. GP82]
MSDASRRTARTVLQLVLGLAAGLPMLVHNAGLPDTLPGLGTALAVAAIVTRAMASPIVDRLLPSWLRTAPAQPPPTSTVPPPATDGGASA